MARDESNRTPIGYESASNPAPPPIPLVSLRLSIPLWSLGLAYAGFNYLAMPKIYRVFKDLKIELPWITKLVVSISRGPWTTGQFSWMWLLPAIFGLPLLISLAVRAGAGSPDSYRSRLRLATILVYLMVAGSLVLLLLALMASMMTLIDTISGIK